MLFDTSIPIAASLCLEKAIKQRSARRHHILPSFSKHHSNRIDPDNSTCILLYKLVTCYASARLQKAIFHQQETTNKQSLEQARKMLPYTGAHPFTLNGFKVFGLSLQSSLHLSLTLLVHYRTIPQYLALDGVYHPISTPLSRCTTLRTRTLTARRTSYGTITLYDAPFQATSLASRPGSVHKTTIRIGRSLPDLGLSSSLFTRSY